MSDLSGQLAEARARVDLEWRILALMEENASLRKDAERYRWLRKNDYDIGSYHRKHEYNADAWFEHLGHEEIDACIADDNRSPENP